MRFATPAVGKVRSWVPLGGVPPFPHGEGVLAYPDVSLGRFGQVWAAAGAPNAVFKVGASDLFRHLGRGPFDLAAPQK